MISGRVGHGQVAVGASVRRGSNRQNRSGAQQIAVETAEAGAQVGGTAAHDWRQVKAAVDRDVADLAGVDTAYLQGVARQQLDTTSGPEDAALSAALEVQQAVADHGQAQHSLGQLQNQTTLKKLQHRLFEGVAGKSVSELCSIGMKHPGPGHAETAETEASRVLDTGEQARVNYFQLRHASPLVRIKTTLDRAYRPWPQPPAVDTRPP